MKIRTCPLKSTSSAEVPCEEETCAWWVSYHPTYTAKTGETGACAILCIAEKQIK